MRNFIPAENSLKAPLGESVRIIRELKGLTQHQLVKLCDIPQITSSSIETARVNLGVERAKKTGPNLHCHPAHSFPRTGMHRSVLLPNRHPQ